MPLRATVTSLLAASALLLSGLGAPAASAQPDDDRLDRASRLNGMNKAELDRVLSTDPTAHLDRNGRLYYVDLAPANAPEEPAPLPSGAAPFPLADTFTLHSKPGAQRTIHLDFDGYDVTGTVWDDSYPALPTAVGAYNFEGTGASFSDAEREAIQALWQLVAEDFAPFDVDVTTQPPTLSAIDRSGSGDLVYGTTAVITSDPDWNNDMCGGCSGQAYIGVFDHYSSGELNHQYYQPAMVLAGALGNDPFYTAQTTSHEVGHNIGLNHDGRGTSEYYFGVNGGLWAPIMGASFDNPVSQWSKGEYSSATNTEDDFAVAGSNGMPLRADEAAAPLGAGTLEGYVTSAADIDVYPFSLSCAGTFTAAATPAEYGANLDLLLRVRDSGGTEVAFDNPAAARASNESATGLGASVSTALPAGSYTLEVDGTSAGTWTGGGYGSAYGSVGAYAVTTSGCLGPAPGVAPDAPASLSATADHANASVTLDWDPPADDGGAPVTGYQVRVDGGDPLAVGNVTTYTVTSLSRTTHSFSVAAVNSVAVGDSAATSATIKSLPGAPGSLQGEANSRSVTLTWSAPQTGGTPVTGYVVQRDDATPFTVGATPLTYTFTGLKSGTHEFTVAAVNEAGVGPTDLAVAHVTYVPSAPSEVRAKAGAKGGARTVKVAWKPPADAGGLPVTAYRVLALRTKDGQVLKRRQSPILTAGTRSLALRLAAGRWRIQVRASNSVGWGAWSAPTRAVRPR